MMLATLKKPKYLPVALLAMLILLPVSDAAAGPFKQNYDRAYKAYQAAKSEKDYTRVAGMFHELSKRNDAGILKANTFYWQGECCFRVKDFLQALQMFERVLVYPLSYKEEHARYKVAACYEKLNRKKQAEWEFSRFLRDYPNSSLAPTARKSLETLRQ